MFPGLIAFATPTLGEFCFSLAAEIGKTKTLSFLEKQGEPIINHCLARALVRALAGSLIERLNAWSEIPEGKQNKDYTSFAIKQLQALSYETEEKNADWTAFLETFNSTTLHQALETIRCKQPMQTLDLGEKAMESLQGFFSDPKKNQKALSNFCDFLSKEDGAAFNSNLYERFSEEIKEDPVTFNAFIIDFLSQIYANIKSTFPNADALADTLSSFATQLDKMEAKIDTVPVKTVELLQNSGILITKEEHRESLKEFSKELVNEYRSSPVTGEHGELILKKLTEIQFALFNPQGLEESYIARINQLEEQTAQLQALKGAFPERLLDEAIAALRQGNDQTALDVFKQVDKLSEASIAVAAESKFQQGLIAEQKVQYSAALEFVVRACELVPNNQRYLNTAGNIYGFLGAFDKAIGYYEQALAIRQSVLPTNHMDIAISLNNLGITWQYKGDYDKAIGYYEQALAIWQSVLPTNYPFIATSLNNLGGAWHHKGDYDKAVGYYEKALAIRQSVLPSNHPDIANSLNNLGGAWHYKGDYDKAIGYHKKSLAIWRSILPTDHPDIAGSLNNLGTIWQDKSDYDKAIGYYEQALAIRQSVLPTNHPDIATSLNSLGNAWHHKGDYDKAIGYYEQSLAIRQSVLPTNHPDIANSLNNLGTVWYHKDDYDKAIGYHKKSLAIWQSIFPPNHPYIATSLNNLGKAWQAKGNRKGGSMH